MRSLIIWLAFCAVTSSTPTSPKIFMRIPDHKLQMFSLRRNN